MAAQPLIRMYEAYGSAAQAVQELEVAGILRCDISILTSHFVDRGTNGMTPDRLELTAIADLSRAGEGHAASPAISAGMGLLSGLRALTITDIGPVVTAGWLTSSAAGHSSGYAPRGLVSALTDSGLNERRARLYANGVHRGATLVAVRSDGEHAGLSQSILERHSPIDPEIFDITHHRGSLAELTDGSSETWYQADGDSRAIDIAQPSSVGIFRT